MSRPVALPFDLMRADLRIFFADSEITLSLREELSRMVFTATYGSFPGDRSLDVRFRERQCRPLLSFLRRKRDVGL